MTDSKYIIIVDKKTDSIRPNTDVQVMTATDYITNKGDINLRHSKKTKIINLCGNYDYLSKGYYCSLLAEARSQKSIPATQDIIGLQWKRLYQSSLPELNALLDKTFKEPMGDQVSRTYLIFFGRIETAGLQPLARRLFDIYRFPIIALQISYDDKWQIDSIEPWSLDDIPAQKQDDFHDALTRFTGTAWSRRFTPAKEKYWLAVLHDPKEKMPPSNKGAINKLISIGRKMNCFVDPITKTDLPILLEYDALFIRETTSIDHHTFRFAHKAEKEGIPVIDDTQSIIRCCNKVFLNELLTAQKVPVPKTVVLTKTAHKTEDIDLDYPFIVKIPDGSFSRGIHKVHNREDFLRISRNLFAKSDIILAQEFVQSDYDWRIGVLGGEPLYASQYYMAKGHWQIYHHQQNGKVTDGAHKTLAIPDVPKDVVETAVKACKQIGNGLYGVDLKMTDKGIYVIEVNDNPNLDAGVEDQILGDTLYKRVIDHFIQRISA